MHGIAGHSAWACPIITRESPICTSAWLIDPSACVFLVVMVALNALARKSSCRVTSGTSR